MRRCVGLSDATKVRLNFPIGDDQRFRRQRTKRHRFQRKEQRSTHRLMWHVEARFLHEGGSAYGAG
jgi:hypothetical protein